jgi:hypothetical protein
LKRRFCRLAGRSVCKDVLDGEIRVEKLEQDFTEKRLVGEFVQDKITRYVKDIPMLCYAMLYRVEFRSAFL